MAAITIEFASGDDIRYAFGEAVRIGNLLNCDVKFTFNEVFCVVDPSSDPEAGAKAWEDVRSKGPGIKHVICVPGYIYTASV